MDTIDKSATQIIKIYMQNMFDGFEDYKHYNTWEEFFQSAKDGTEYWMEEYWYSHPKKLQRILDMKDGQFREEKRWWKNLKR